MFRSSELHVVVELRLVLRLGLEIGLLLGLGFVVTFSCN